MAVSPARSCSPRASEEARHTSPGTAFTLNGVPYRRPARPVVVVCVDRGDPAYIEAGLRARVIPNIERFMKDGFYAVVRGTVPSFTCPNNISIVTGAEPDVHGISGNFCLESDTRNPVAMTSPELLRCSTVLAQYARLGLKIASISAKDKLREQLQKGIDVSAGHVSFSAQNADHCTLKTNGIEHVSDYVGMPAPDMYSAELSLFALEAAIRLLDERRPDVTYLSLSDWVQHKYASGDPEALDFYGRIDKSFGRLAGLGALVGITADHGMNDKAPPDGTPNVIWLPDVLDAEFGPGTTTVICPITDPFVAHHGALGGFVRAYRIAGTDPEAVIRLSRGLPGVESVWHGADAARMFELPPDREGDVVVISEAGTCVGGAQAEHDLSGLEGHRLRTHGGVSESDVPLILSEPLNDEYRARAARGRLRSHQIFDYAINGTASTAGPDPGRQP